MSATLCTNCRKLISKEEKKCPHCGAIRPTLLQGPLGVLQRRNPLEFIVGISGLLYLAALMVDPSSAFQLNLSEPLTGLLGFASPSSQALFLLGMTGSVAWICGHWWTLLTASFLHGSLLHIFFNLSWLRTLGTLCLQLFGPIRLINIYILTGAGGFLFSNLYKNHPTIGASCALFGMMGVLIAYGRRRGGTFGESLSRQVWAWAIVGFLISMAIPMVNNAGHLGGFLTGLVMGRLVPLQGQRSSRKEQLLALALVVGTLAGFGLSMWEMWSPVSDGTPVCL